MDSSAVDEATVPRRRGKSVADTDRPRSHHNDRPPEPKAGGWSSAHPGGVMCL